MIQNKELNGFILLNKPKRKTSSDVCIEIKEFFNAKKVGHAGTLDMNVDGVLIIAINDSTKLMPFVNKLDKEYIGKAKIHKNISKKELEDSMNLFIGNIRQIPPRKSHVKREERTRKIYEFKLLNFDDKKREFEFFVRCEAGTYIRKLIYDLGEKIGGSHMVHLTRIKQGPFKIEETTLIKDISKDKILMDSKILERLK